MVHSKAVCGVPDGGVFFEVENGYAYVLEDGSVYLVDHWAYTAKREPIVDVSLIDDKKINKCSSILRDYSPDTEAVERLKKVVEKKDGSLLDKIQDELLKKSRKTKKEVYI